MIFGHILHDILQVLDRFLCGVALLLVIVVRVVVHLLLERGRASGFAESIATLCAMTNYI